MEVRAHSGVPAIGFWGRGGRFDILGILAVFWDREVGDMGRDLRYDTRTRPSL